MIFAYYALHYGSDYLAYSLRSIYENVDKIVIVYSPQPSYGTVQTIPNPDSRENLQDEIIQFGDPSNKILWYEKSFGSEGEHRDYAVAKCIEAGATHIVIVDADEIWNPPVLAAFVHKLTSEKDIRHQMIRMDTLWRSFDHHCSDNMWPHRGINLAAKSGHGYIQEQVFHFGYARELQHIEYKMSIHGHKHEIRPGWLEKFKNWKPDSVESHFDVHPTCVGTWTVIPFDPNKLPTFMQAHKYWGRAVI